MKTLRKFAQVYIKRRDISDDYAKTLLHRAKALEVFSGSDDIAKILTEENVNGYLADLKEKGKAPATVKGYRGDVLTLWRAAADDDLVEMPRVRRVRQPKVAAPSVDCYTTAEVNQLIAGAHKMEGETGDGIPRNLYWQSIIRMAYETGLRRSDLWLLKRSDIREDGLFSLSMSKTQRRRTGRVRQATLDAIARTFPPERQLIFPWCHAKGTFTMHFYEVVILAGVKRGCFKWLRRSSGSYVEAVSPGNGPKHLGHTSPAVFYRHYDAAMVSSVDQPLPPALD